MNKTQSTITDKSLSKTYLHNPTLALNPSLQFKITVSNDAESSDKQNTLVINESISNFEKIKKLQKQDAISSEFNKKRSTVVYNNVIDKDTAVKITHKQTTTPSTTLDHQNQ